MVRVFRSWYSFDKMVSKVVLSFKEVMNFFLLMIIFVFIFSLLGVQLFANNFETLDEKPRFNFNNIYEAIISVFICLIGDDWQKLMHNQMRA